MHPSGLAVAAICGQRLCHPAVATPRLARTPALEKTGTEWLLVRKQCGPWRGTPTRRAIALSRWTTGLAAGQSKGRP